MLNFKKDVIFFSGQLDFYCYPNVFKCLFDPQPHSMSQIFMSVKTRCAERRKLNEFEFLHFSLVCYFCLHRFRNYQRFMRFIYDRMIFYVEYGISRKVVCLFCLDRSSQHYSVVDQTEGEICRLFGQNIFWFGLCQDVICIPQLTPTNKMY